MKKEKKLSSTTIFLLIIVALFFDLLQIIFTFLFLGWLISFYAFMTFWLWFKLKGISFATPKRSGIAGGGFIIELVPFLNMLPAWTLAVTLIILDVKSKELISKLSDIGENAKNSQ